MNEKYGLEWRANSFTVIVAMNEPQTIVPTQATIETDPNALRSALLRRLPGRIRGRGEIVFLAIPALAEHYTAILDQTWRALGRQFTEEELDYLRKMLREIATEAFALSPYSRLSVTYETNPPPHSTLTWSVQPCLSSIEAEYEEWISTRTPPLFGEHPDAKVMDLARTLGDPTDCPILDIGAGTGRNTFPLARLGFKTDAVELAPALAEILRNEAAKEQLNVTVYVGDILDSELALPVHRYRWLILAEVIAHFRSVEQLRSLFLTANRIMVVGGLLTFSVFLAKDGYEPDELARQISQAIWCSLFTKTELENALRDLPFDFVALESCLNYEKASLPAAHWPPCGWFEDWSAGLDLFDLTVTTCPMEMHWVTLRKTR